MTLFAISDTHFSHKNMLNFVRKDNLSVPLRPWKSVEEADEALIENWNKTVGHNDTVIHLGDFTFGGKHNIARHARRLNGKIILLLGNHDYSARDYVDHFKDVTMWHETRNKFRVPLVFTHVPQHVTGFRSRFGDPAVNVHGHLHDLHTGEPWHVNVCVENIGFKPIAVEEIVAKL